MWANEFGPNVPTLGGIHGIIIIGHCFKLSHLKLFNAIRYYPVKFINLDL